MVSELSEKVKKAAPEQKLLMVDRMVNLYRYLPDKVLYQQEDYWASADEFLRNGGGDCEDFAITKKRILDNLNIDSVFVYFKKHNQGHVALLAKQGRSLWLLDIDGGTRKLSPRELKRFAVFEMASEIQAGRTFFEQDIKLLKLAQKS